MGAPRKVVQWLRAGVPLKWSGAAPSQEREATGAQTPEVYQEMKELVRRGAFIVSTQPALVSPVFCVPKKDGTKRLIHDLRQVNRHIAPPKFTLKGVKQAGEVVRQSRYLVALDLCKGYQQVAMAPEARRYLGAQFGGKTVVSTVLPFGLSISPYVFTRITEWLGRTIRRRFGLNVAVYIDDILLGADTQEALAQGLDRVLGLFDSLGVVVSQKTSHQPDTSVEYLGFLWDARAKTVSITQARRREYRRRIRNLLRAPQKKSVWQQTVGKLLFLRTVVGPAVRHIRSIISCMTNSPKGLRIPPLGEAREDLLWWQDTLSRPVVFPLEVKPLSATITTDASEHAIGALVEVWNPGAPSEAGGRQEASRDAAARAERRIVQQRAGDPSKHVNVKELEALLQTIRQHRELLANRRAVWYTDSMVARAAVARQGTQRLGREAWDITKSIIDVMQDNNITLKPKHVPGRLNALVDSLSRPGEERLAWDRALAEITGRYGPLEEDPCGWTREPTSELESMRWVQRRSLLVPHVSQIEPVLELLATMRCPPSQDPPSAWPRMAVIVTPLWRGARWWPLLARLRHDFIHLGRLPHAHLEQWSMRNGHWPDWTASLICLSSTSGLRAH